MAVYCSRRVGHPLLGCHRPVNNYKKEGGPCQSSCLYVYMFGLHIADHPPPKFSQKETIASEVPMNIPEFNLSSLHLPNNLS